MHSNARLLVQSLAGSRLVSVVLATLSLGLCSSAQSSLATPRLSNGTCGTTVAAGVIVAETWTEAGSPYCVQGDISVSLLTIEPGATVFIDGPYRIQVLSTINAIGTELNPITFASKDGITPWKGLLFSNTVCGSTLSYCNISGSDDSAIQVANSNPYINNCTIENNSAISGGGINIINTGVTMRIDGCTIQNNTFQSDGGGIRAIVDQGRLILTNCMVANNSDTSTNVRGGGMFLQGTGLFEIRNCFVTDNSCVTSCNVVFCSNFAHGAGIYLNGDALIENSVIANNDASAAGSQNQSKAFSYGGGLYLVSGDLTLRNTMIGCNSVSTSCSGFQCVSDPRGSGIYVGGGTAEIENSTIVRNATQGLRTDVGGVNVTNSVFYFNNPLGTMPETYGSQVSGSGTPTVSYSDMQGGFAGSNNIDFNPVFTGPDCSMTSYDAGDLKIVLGSPCVDMGNPASAFNDGCSPPGLGGPRNDIGAHGGPLICNADCRATATSRNGGSNPASLTVTPPVIGTTVVATVDLAGTTGHNSAVVFGFLDFCPLEVTLGTGATLLVNVTDPAGELLAQPVTSGPVAVFNMPVPNVPSLCGLVMSTQAIHFGGVIPFALSNAQELVFGR